MNKLNPKQERFCREYILDFNGTAAAIRAGYSEKTAGQQASQLLTKLKIKSRIAELSRESVKRFDITLDEVMAELRKIAFSNMADFADWTDSTVTLKPKVELDRSLLAAIEQVAITSAKDGSPQLRIRLHSKLRAIESIIRLHELSEIEARMAEIERKMEQL